MHQQLYIPQYFAPHEVFSPFTLQQYSRAKGLLSKKIWLLMDGRVLRTLDLLREVYGPIVVNDYYWGGSNCHRGYRNLVELMDHEQFLDTGEVTTSFSTPTSQHFYGRAIDFVSKKFDAYEIRADMVANPLRPCYQSITAVEEGVNWVHFDVRPTLRGEEIYFFRA